MSTNARSANARFNNAGRSNLLRAAVLLAIGALVAGAPVLGAASSAQAHNYLVSSTPSAGETLTTLPPQFVITTNEPLLTIGGSVAGFGLQVKDSAGKYYGDGCVKVEGAAMSTNAVLGAPGEYTVTWQVVSADGHTVSDDFTFTWAPTDDATPTAGSDTPGDCNGTASVTPPDQTGGGVDRNAKVDLSDALWIGGAVLAVGVAVAVAIVIAGRRAKKTP